MRLLPMFILVLATCALLLAGCATVVAPTAAPQVALSAEGSVAAGDVELLGVISVPYNANAFDTPVGGLSAVTYDGENDVYYFLSDDRAANGPARIYQAAIDLGDGTLDAGDLTWTGLIPLLDEGGAPFARGAIDPEGLAFTGDHFYVSSEGNAATQPPLPPAIIEFGASGAYVASLPLPTWYLPTADGSRGVRNNQALESLTLTPDGRHLISGVENALVQDGPAATLDTSSPARLLLFDLTTNRVAGETVYTVDPIPAAPKPATGDADNGLADLLALDNVDADQGGTLLALERSYVEGMGNTVRLYRVSTAGAMNVGELDALTGAAIAAPVTKTLLLDFGDLGRARGFAPDNLEGLTWGPRLADGRPTLLVVSDNNFNPSQTTQLWALALPLNP